MRMSDFFGWVNNQMRPGTMNQMNAAWQNRNQTPQEAPEEKEEEIVDVPVEEDEV